MPYDGKRGRPDGLDNFPAQGNIQRVGPSAVAGALDLIEDETVDVQSGHGRLSIAGYDLGEATLFATTRYAHQRMCGLLPLHQACILLDLQACCLRAD
jgi:hypothetical protein